MLKNPVASYRLSLWDPVHSLRPGIALYPNAPSHFPHPLHSYISPFPPFAPRPPTFSTSRTISLACQYTRCAQDGLLRSAIEHSQQTALPIHWYHLYYSVRGSTLACFQAITVLGVCLRIRERVCVPGHWCVRAELKEGTLPPCAANRQHLWLAQNGSESM